MAGIIVKEPFSASEGLSPCTVCKEEGETTPATRWCHACKSAFCNDCLRLHDRMPISKHHDVQKITDIAENERETQFMCNTHKNEEVKFYCRDCKEPICLSCHARIHFVCDTVVKIQDMLPEVRSKLRTMKQNLQLEISRRQAGILKRRSQLKTVLEIASKTEAQIKEGREMAVNIVKAKECDLIGRLKAIKTRKVGKHCSNPLYEEMDAETGQEETGIHPTEATLTEDSEGDYETLHTSLSTSSTTSSPSISELKQIQVKCDTEKISEAIKMFGSCQIDTIPLGVADLTSTSVLIGTLDTKTYKDTQCPVLKDVLVMNVDDIRTVIVTSLNVPSIKSFYTQHNKHNQSILELNERPNAITIGEGNQILATAPFSFQIHTVSVYPDLRLSKSISTMISYFGIVYLGQGRIAACVRDSIWRTSNGSRVDILDMAGKVLRSVQVPGIQSPDFACLTNEGAILLSDVHSQSVVAVSPDGHVFFTSKHKIPGGVAAMASGYVLVVDRDTDRVLQLNRSGEHVRDILTSEDGLEDVCGICLDENESVYVTSGQHVKVYRFE